MAQSQTKLSVSRTLPLFFSTIPLRLYYTDISILVVGNHRDAWIAGGAGDPNSGSAVMNEVIRSFGEALKLGWKPLRTVVFASWDGEEYGLIGSTEWVEEYLPWLNKANVAYVVSIPLQPSSHELR